MRTQTQEMPLAQNVLIPEIPKKRFVSIPLRRFLARGVTTVSQWFNRRLYRRELIHLSDHILKDIGMTRWEAQKEYAKPFWKE